MGGKATLQDICGWMMDNYDWYRYNEGAGWEVRQILLCNLHTTSHHVLETLSFVLLQILLLLADELTH